MSKHVCHCSRHREGVGIKLSLYAYGHEQADTITFHFCQFCVC